MDKKSSNQSTLHKKALQVCFILSSSNMKLTTNWVWRQPQNNRTFLLWTAPIDMALQSIFPVIQEILPFTSFNFLPSCKPGNTGSRFRSHLGNGSCLALIQDNFKFHKLATTQRYIIAKIPIHNNASYMMPL